jgi:hypothetical protein
LPLPAATALPYTSRRLAYQRGHVTVLDRAGLKHRSCECHDVVSKEYLRLLPVRWGQ